MTDGITANLLDMADCFSQLVELAEGQRQKLLALGWSETAAEQCATHLLATLQAKAING